MAIMLNNNTICSRNNTCSLKRRDGEGEEPSQEEQDPIPFHKHCQATVLSAYGPDGNGKSWDVLYNERNNLPNLPDNWISYFTGNRDNITQDLRSILQLINQAFGQDSVKRLTLKFLNPDNTISFQQTKELLFDTIFELKVGRKIELNINGKKISFHTLIENPGDIFDVEFPQKKISIVKNDQINSFTVLGQDYNNQTIDVSHDYCLVPGKSTSSGAAEGKTITPEKNKYVYRWNTSTSFDLTIDLKNYWGTNHGTHNLIQFEYHISNTGNSTININNIYLKNNGTTIPIPIQALTDKLTIDSYRINVYVFRIDCYGPSLSWRRMTYSLAYVTEFGV